MAGYPPQQSAVPPPPGQPPFGPSFGAGPPDPYRPPYGGQNPLTGPGFQQPIARPGLAMPVAPPPASGFQGSFALGTAPAQPGVMHDVGPPPPQGFAPPQPPPHSSSSQPYARPPGGMYMPPPPQIPGAPAGPHGSVAAHSPASTGHSRVPRYSAPPFPPAPGPQSSQYGGGYPYGQAQGGPGQGGLGPPPQPPPGPGFAPPVYAPGQDAYGAQRLVENFESLTLGGTSPGTAPDTTNMMAFPRPCGDQLAAALAPAATFDQGNCSPANMRMTVNAIPNSTALRSRWSLPVGVIVHPMADELEGHAVPLLPLTPAGIVRCRRCRTYMNPFMTWTEGGRRFRCNVCSQSNDVPPEYFSVLDADGRRRDIAERPELGTGTVEYVAPPEYMVRAPMPPVYFFVIDVSYAAVASGAVAAVAAGIRDSLDNLPGDERTMVGFLTFDSTLHFYNLKAGLSQPQMLVVAELEEQFLPLPDELLVNLRDSRAVVDTLLEALPHNFGTTQTVDAAMGPALQAAFLVMSHLGGKLLLFQSSTPSLGIGKARARENFALYNTDREAALRQPEDAFFKRFAAECSRVQITLDAFVLGAQSMDLASLAAIPRYTCGQVYYYPAFARERDGPKLGVELRRNLTRPTAWEAVMRIRCSKGLKISSFHGHFFNRSTDLLALPTCDPDKCFAVQISHEDTVVAHPVAYVQCALLYTSSNGERRIRVHTMVVPVVSELSELYKALDGGAMLAMLAKLAVEKSLSARLEDTRQAIQAKITQMLKEFRLLHAPHVRFANRLIYPDTARFLMIYALGLVKTAALRGGAKDVNADERIAVGHEMMAASSEQLQLLAYPACYSLHEPAGNWGNPGADGKVELPLTAALTSSMLSENGAYLLDNGRLFVLWLGRQLHRTFYLEVFGVDSAAVPLDSVALSVEPERATPMSRRVVGVLSSLRLQRSTHQQCFVVRQGTPVEAHVVPFFIEDRAQGTLSYYDWMLMLHRAVLK